MLFASIVNNRGRSIGRGGLGAVLGSKRLKALVIDGHGTRKPPVADPERLEFIVYEAEKLLKSNPITSTALPEFGTAVLVNVLDQAGALPTRNHRESRFEGAAAISGESLKREHVTRRSACRGCIIGCARRTQAGGESGEGPEYETIWAFGAQCGVSDLTAIVQANYACNRAGMDTITHGLHHRLRHGAHRDRPAAGRPALRRRAGHHRPRRGHRRRRGPRRRARARLGALRRAARPPGPLHERQAAWRCRPTTRAA